MYLQWRMWFSPPLFPYTLEFPYLRVHVYVINEKSKFYTKNAQKNEKKRNISDWRSRFQDFRMTIRCT
jgi:hypothetical protein